jgi:hypothetical protein
MKRKRDTANPRNLSPEDCAFLVSFASEARLSIGFDEEEELAPGDHDLLAESSPCNRALFTLQIILEIIFGSYGYSQAAGLLNTDKIVVCFMIDQLEKAATRRKISLEELYEHFAGL